MSDPITPEPIPAPRATAPIAPKPKGGLTLAALILGIVAIVCAVIPGLSFIAFVPALVALVLGIIGLATKAPGRGKALAGIILGPVAFVVAIIVSVAFIVGSVRSTVDEADPAPNAEAPAAEDPEPVEEVAEEGSRDNPAPAGSVIEMSDNSGPIWHVQLGAANLNAGDVVAAENQFNPPADAGYQYVLVPVTVTYVGDQSGTPWLDIDIAFVSAAGTTHEETFAVIPNPLNDIAEMYNGATATGNLLVMAPSADIEQGTWAISPLFGTPYFVKVV